MEQAGRHDLIRTRRREHKQIKIGDILVLVRDQAPLHKGNLALPPGFTYEDLVESINKRIFFWPGTAAGPISYGVRHFERYQHENPVILRINSRSMFHANPDIEPRFCRYNSGSPRCSNGQKSPRGLDTFVHAADFSGTPSAVVEVTFERPIVIPGDATAGENPRGPWHPVQ